MVIIRTNATNDTIWTLLSKYRLMDIVLIRETALETDILGPDGQWAQEVQKVLLGYGWTVTIPLSNIPARD